MGQHSLFQGTFCAAYSAVLGSDTAEDQWEAKYHLVIVNIVFTITKAIWTDWHSVPNIRGQLFNLGKKASDKHFWSSVVSSQNSAGKRLHQSKHCFCLTPMKDRRRWHIESRTWNLFSFCVSSVFQCLGMRAPLLQQTKCITTLMQLHFSSLHSW